MKKEIQTIIIIYNQNLFFFGIAMIKKSLITLGLFLLGSSTYAAQLFIQPNFADPRFEPADKLHAGCLNTATVSIKTSNKENISSFRFVISYEPQSIEVLEIKPDDKYKDIMDSKIEYDKIIVSMLNKPLPQWETTSLFTISFKSNEFATESLFAIHKPSYVIDQNNKEILVFVEQKLSFEKVSECEPDVLPPTITLVKPQNTSALLGLDTYFTFSLKDEGKGIDPTSLRLNFDGITYTGSDPAFVWQKDQLSFYPRKWLPIGKTLDLAIVIGDKQSYWWANTSKKTFTFSTHSWIVFENALTPTMYRNLAGKAKNIYATAEECAALTFLWSNQTSLQFPFEPIASLSKKINCPFDPSPITSSLEKNKSTAKSTVFISVFSVLGWVLFAITFVLKLHYLLSYKKQKKIAKSLKSSQSLQ